MASAARGADAIQLPPASRVGARAGARRLVRRALRGRAGRDLFFVYTAAMVPIPLLVALASRHPRDLAAVLLLSPIAVALQALLGAVPARSRPLTPLGWSFLRLTVALLYVAALAPVVGGPSQPLQVLYIPVVVAAAALGTMQAAVFGALASLIYLAPQLEQLGTNSAVGLRGLALAGASILVAVGTRRLVIAVERSTRDLRSAMVTERRRSRQIAGLEAVSRILVDGGSGPDALHDALGVLSEQFHYHFVTVYLLEGTVLRLAAQRGYEEPPATLDGTAGVIGRVMRTRESAFVPDVSRDPEYLAAFSEVVSEVCSPLLIDGQFLGVLNVEARTTLDRSDRDVIATLADRFASMVALGRERQALSERAAVFRALNEFTNLVGAELELSRLAAVVVDGARRVVSADVVVLTVLDRPTGRYLLRGYTDAKPEFLDREIKPGEGLSGRAIRDRAVVFDDAYAVDRFPAAYRDALEPGTMLGAGVPLVRDGVVVGALSVLRRAPAERFRPIEVEAMELLAGHAALALANAFLHDEVEQAAIRDPLTGLFNRRHFDASLDRMLAGWRRASQAERRPLSAVMFDLDHFGQFNKQHGHQVGDEVLKTFAGVLADRFRSADLVARFGGEEFVVIMEGATRDRAVQVAEEVRALLAERPVLADDGERLAVTVSAGCAELDAATATREQLLRTADVALFMAKRAGRDRVVAA
jgi:diguanylate cyclase (GGDEF)-like protein